MEYWSNPDNARQLIRTSLPSISGWPPSPMVFGLFLVPIARMFYRRFFTQFSHWVLGTRPGPVVPVRRFVWQLNEGGPFAIRIGANVHRAPPQAQQAPEPAPGAQPEQEPNAAVPDVVAAAEQTIEIMTSSMGRLVGGALLVPAISNAMGSLLFRLSKRSYLLRKFLAVRPPLKGFTPPLPLGPFSYKQHWDGMSTLKQIGMTLRIALGAVWTGTQTWAECDPVW